MVGNLIHLRFVQCPADLRLRELTGHDERTVGGIGTADAVHLLDRLLQPAFDGSAAPLAGTLTASDRDQLLAITYRNTFGDRVESTVSCYACGALFDVDFSLPQLTERVITHAREISLHSLGDGLFEADGMRFRLPLGDDEIAAAYLPPEEAENALLACCLEGSDPVDERAFQDMIEQIAPLLDLELGAQCHECGQDQPVHFDIQSFLLGALLAQRRRLWMETHHLALAYSWSLDEILSLTYGERRRLAGMIEKNSSRDTRY